MTQIDKESLLKESFSRAPVVLCGLYLRHWHCKHKLTPCCYENHLRIISLISIQTSPAAQRCSGLLERSSWICLVCHKPCGKPVPFCGDSWEWAQLCLATTMDRDKATELSSWSLFFAQQCFKWHFSVWTSWELLGNAAPSWILLPCGLEVTEWLLLPQEDRERKMRKVGQSEKEKSPARLGILDLTQQGMWNIWEWWALCVADSPAANSASQQRWKEKF